MDDLRSSSPAMQHRGDSGSVPLGSTKFLRNLTTARLQHQIAQDSTKSRLTSKNDSDNDSCRRLLQGHMIECSWLTAITGASSPAVGDISCGLQLGRAAWKEARAHLHGLFGSLHAHSGAMLAGTKLHRPQMEYCVSTLLFFYLSCDSATPIQCTICIIYINLRLMHLTAFCNPWVALTTCFCQSYQW